MSGAVRVSCTEPAGFNTAPAYPAGVPFATCPADPPGTIRYDCSYAPVNVMGLTATTAITVGDYHTCAIRTGGQVACWGDNSFNQVNATSSPLHYEAPQNTTITDAIAIAAGATTTCAIRTGGQVVCWGDNSLGQLGNGTTGASVGAPVNVTGLSNATRIVAGAQHFCALRSTGQAVCWGNGANGQLGDNAGVNRTTPVNLTPM
jgi:alpha-tubulin suppressor-like RCC1 family protein